jgi:hypothetical protein
MSKLLLFSRSTECDIADDFLLTFGRHDSYLWGAALKWRNTAYTRMMWWPTCTCSVGKFQVVWFWVKVVQRCFVYPGNPPFSIDMIICQFLPSFHPQWTSIKPVWLLERSSPLLSTRSPAYSRPWKWTELLFSIQYLRLPKAHEAIKPKIWGYSAWCKIEGGHLVNS